jgi:DNA/RNA endonuclease G (NUC1)
MSIPSVRRVTHVRLVTAVLAFGALLAGCSSAEQAVAPVPSTLRADVAPVTAADLATGGVVISQVYGGGGNSGATLKYDFVELHNTSSTTASLAGWSLQYASTTGTTWNNRVNLSGSIPPGGFFLVQLQGGTSGTVDLPTPDLVANSTTGNINMAGAAGKIALVRTTTQLPSVACPTSSDIVDLVGFGNGTNCFEGTVGPTLSLSVTNAAIRNGDGCTDLNDNRNDFTIATAAPRNSATTKLCGAGPSVVVTVTAAPTSIQVGGTSTLNATVTQNGATITPTITWSVTPANVVTLSGTSGASITATGAAAGSATITASANVDGTVYTRSAAVTVTAPAGATARISIDRTRSVPLDSTIQLNATAFDANNVQIPGMTFTWSTTTPELVTVSPSGLFTPKAAGRALIDVRSADGYTRSGYFLDIVAAGTGALAVTTFRDGAALPVGFQDILNVRDAATNASIITGLTFASSAPAIVSVETDGTITAKALGSAVITVTETATGRSGTFGVSTVNAAAANPSIYQNHLEFGTPTDATPANDLLLNGRSTFVASYNEQLGQPNWVAYNLDAAHDGTVARCDCFTHDPLLPASFTRISSADYLSSGYSRGHMVMSNDRTMAPYDNATTYLFSNIIPQTAANNEGPWQSLEQALGDSAAAGREVYIIAGGAKHQGTLKNLGNVAIPTRTWKVAVIMGKDQGLAQFGTGAGVSVIAVDMPNTATMPSSNWRSYVVSVDSVEALTGYDLLSALPDGIEQLVEARRAGVRQRSMDVQPGTLSLSGTSVVNVTLLSESDFDASTVNAADLRLAVNGGAAVAPLVRGTVVSTTVRDMNGDGRLDRTISFSMSALRAAGFSATARELVLRLAGATPAWEAFDLTPANVVP